MIKAPVQFSPLIIIWFKTFIESHLYLSICGVFLTVFSYKAVAGDVNYFYSLLVGLAIYSVYNYNFLFRIGIGEYNLNRKLNAIRLASISILSFAMFLCLRDDIGDLFVILLAMVICIGYFRPLLSDNKSLRDFIWLKPLSIGLVFSLITALVPYHQSGYNWLESSWLSVGRMFFVASLAILFDIGDILEDQMKRVKTIPSQYGTTKAKFIAILFLLVGLMIEGYGTWVFLIELPALIVMMFTSFLSFLLVIFSSQNRSKWYYLVLADGMIGLPLFMLCFI